MTKFYSVKTGGFYPSEMRGDYEVAGTWPSDAVEISDDDHSALIDGQSSGKIISSGPDGQPILMDPAPTPYSQIASSYLDIVRSIREDVLNRLAGIGFAAMATGDTDTVKAIVTARLALLALTKTPAVLAATDADSLKAAVLTGYKAIAAAVPASVRSAFAGFSL